MPDCPPSSQRDPGCTPSCPASLCPFHTLESLSQTGYNITVPRCAPTRNLLSYILSNKESSAMCAAHNPQPRAQTCPQPLCTSRSCPEFSTSAYSPSVFPASVNSSGSSQHPSVRGSRVGQSLSGTSGLPYAGKKMPEQICFLSPVFGPKRASLD